MVVPGSVASIDLDSLKVAGTSSAAKAEKESPTSLVADRDTAAGAAADVPASEVPADVPADAPASEVPASDATATEATTADEAADVPAPTADMEFTDQELNGGTIPAPAQQQPQN